MNRIILALALSMTAVLPVHAQVPVNDAERTVKETITRTCMERSRTYKQRTEAPTEGVRGSFASVGSGGSLGQAGSGNVMGGGFAGTSVGGIDLSGLMGVVGGVAALKSRNAGQVINALGAVTGALQENSADLGKQGQAIGSIDTLQGGMDQNTSGRLSQAGLWGQAIQSGNTRLQLQNQKLIDQTDSASAAAKVLQYDPSKARLIKDEAPDSDNAVKHGTRTVTLEEVQAELARLQAKAKAAANPQPSSPTPAQ